MKEEQLERSVLDGKDREQLHAIAGAMGVRAATRMKKADLIDAILDAADGNGGEPASDGDDASRGRATRPKRVRSVKASEADDPIAALAAEEEALPSSTEAADEPAPRRARNSAEAQSFDNGASSNESDASDEGPGGGTATATRTRVEEEDTRQSFGEGNRRRRRRRGRGDRQ